MDSLVEVFQVIALAMIWIAFMLMFVLLIVWLVYGIAWVVAGWLGAWSGRRKAKRCQNDRQAHFSFSEYLMRDPQQQTAKENDNATHSNTLEILTR